jgi:hypothetical protein
MASCSGDPADQDPAAVNSPLCELSAEFGGEIYDTGGEIRAGYIAFVEGLLEADVLDDESRTLAHTALEEVRSIEPASSTVGVNAYIATLGADSAAVRFSRHLTPLLEEECWTDGSPDAPFIYFQF